jgi:hypothetical protein
LFKAKRAEEENQAPPAEEVPPSNEPGQPEPTTPFGEEPAAEESPFGVEEAEPAAEESPFSFGD